MPRVDFAPNPIVLFALALAACDKNPSSPVAEQVVVTTDAREYTISSPPSAAVVTVENHTQDAVTVRRCMPGSSVITLTGVDMVVEQQIDRTWRPVDIGFDCLTSGAPRADAVLAPREVAVVLRLVGVVPGRFRVRVAYGIGSNAAPTDTATSATFVYR